MTRKSGVTMTQPPGPNSPPGPACPGPAHGRSHRSDSVSMITRKTGHDSDAHAAVPGHNDRDLDLDRDRDSPSTDCHSTQAAAAARAASAAAAAVVTVAAAAAVVRGRSLALNPLIPGDSRR